MSLSPLLKVVHWKRVKKELVEQKQIDGQFSLPLFCCYLVMITVRLTPIADRPCFEFHLAFKHSFQRRPLLIGDLLALTLLNLLIFSFSSFIVPCETPIPLQHYVCKIYLQFHTNAYTLSS